VGEKEIRQYEIFDKLIDDALREVASKGVDNASDKSVMIACVAILARNSIESLTCSVEDFTRLMKKVFWATLSLVLGFLISALWGYIFLFSTKGS